jgi:L-malate glycosyltransferase
VRTLIYLTQFPSFYTDWDLLRTFRNRMAESVTCKLASRIVCQSTASRYQFLLRQFTAEEKFVHIPNGVEPLEMVTVADRLSLRLSLELPMDPEVPLVVSVSRLSDQKRIDWLLEAWALVEKKTPTAHLVIVGDGPLREWLQGMAAQLGLQRCHFIGSRPNGFRFYQAADLGVISSIYEGHPLALLEAMSCGCPMVGTTVDGIAETIIPGQTGLLVPPGDAPSLADAILQFLDNPEEARRMGEAAREQATRLYSVDDILARQIELLKTELAHARRDLPASTKTIHE